MEGDSEAELVRALRKERIANLFDRTGYSLAYYREQRVRRCRGEVYLSLES